MTHESASLLEDEAKATQQPDQTDFADSVDEDEDETLLFKYSISSYGADYTVDSLVTRIKRGDIVVPAFQRAYVWTPNQASKFIESLLLGLPVPGITLSKETESQKLLVIDGQQRLKTLEFFYRGAFDLKDKPFKLINVQPRYTGLTYETLKEEDRRQLDDSILHATIVRQEQPSEDDSSIYYIFERLNTGGTALVPQEIRSAIYRGEFDALLSELNENSAWRATYGPRSKNARDQELILRFFAFYFNGAKYKNPMKGFLNQMMATNRHLQKHSAQELSDLFSSTISVVQQCLGDKVFKPQGTLNAAVFDAVMVGTARRLQKGGIEDPAAFSRAYKKLLKDPTFISVTEKATNNVDSVSKRLQLAEHAFADLT